ncbi:MAG: Multidrug export protein EmrA [Chlamydiae bacterium]|nr:Multidrug export protein EmrA [Chlamydiota bacterium]
MEEKERSSYTIPFLITLASAVGLVVMIFGLFWAFSWRHYVWTNDANIEAYGTDLSANVTEKVIGVFADEGDSVEKGQLIVQLENNVPLAKKAEIEAMIISLEQEILVKQAYLEKVRNDYIRAEEGIQDAVISEQDFDHKQKDFEMATAELKLAIANLGTAQKQLEVIEAQLTHYAVHAPQNGTIAKRWIWYGDVTSPGQSMFTMYDLEDVWVIARLEEEKIEYVRLGSEVEITIDAYPGYTFTGEVFAIKGAAASQFSLVPQNNATGNYTKVAQRVPIKISVKKPNNFPEDKPLYLFPGMSVEVWIKKS